MSPSQFPVSLPTLRERISRSVSDLFGSYAFLALALAWLAISAAALAHKWSQVEHDKTLLSARLRADLENILAQQEALNRSPVLWTGLTDSMGREAYMLPLVKEINQSPELRFQVLDYLGREVVGLVLPGLAPDAYLPVVSEAMAQRRALLRPVPRPQRSGLLVLVVPIVSPQSDDPVGALMASYDPFAAMDRLKLLAPDTGARIAVGPAAIGHGGIDAFVLTRTESIQLGEPARALGLTLTYIDSYRNLLLALAALLALFWGLTRLARGVVMRKSQKVARELTERLDRLVTICDEIAGGTRTLPDTDPHGDEISRLTNSLRSALVEQQGLADRLRPVARVFDTSAQAILVTSPAGEILDVNPALLKLTGYERAHLLGHSAGKLYRDQTAPAQTTEIRRSLREQGFWRGETQVRRADGQTVPVMYSVSRFSDEFGADRGYVTSFSDISEIKSTQRMLHDLAMRDALTGLPNYRAISAHLQPLLAAESSAGKDFVLLFIDLDRLKNINDSFGHEGGDDVIRQVALYLQDNLPKPHYLSRRSGDEFICTLEDYASFESLRQSLEEVFRRVAVPMRLSSGETLQVSFSVGAIRHAAGESVTLRELLVGAGNALQAAKEMGRAQICWHNPALAQRRQRRLRVEQRLRHAIEQGALAPHYQPELDMRDGRIVAFEALARWTDEQLGPVSPAEFIPVAEETGLISAITELMFRKVLADLPTLRQHFPRVKVAFNTSPGLLEKDGVFALLAELNASHSGLCEALELEITETHLAGVSTAFMAQLQSIIGLGVQVAIDDFGTGYSSLSRLAAMPVHRLKIDASFVASIHQESYRRVVQTILSLSSALGLEVTAEGVETEAQRSALLALGCHRGQGWLYARAMPLAQVLALSQRLEASLVES